MSLYILDTDHVSLFQRQHPQVVRRVQNTPANQLAVTIVTFEEQLRGRLNRIRQAQKSDALISAYKNLKATKDFFNTINMLDFTQKSHYQFQELINQKIRIGTQDLKIASIALSVNAIVVTRNQKDFVKVPNLEIEDWTIEV